MARQDRAAARHEIEAQLRDVAPALFKHARAAQGRTDPGAVRYFVAAGMDGAQRHAGLAEQSFHLADHGVDEAVHRGQRDADHVVVPQLHGFVGRGIVGIVEAVGPGGLNVVGGQQAVVAHAHRHHRGARVAGHVELGDHLDVARMGMPQDGDEFVVRVVAGAGRAVDIGAGTERWRQAGAPVRTDAAPCADLG